MPCPATPKTAGVDGQDQGLCWLRREAASRRRLVLGAPASRYTVEQVAVFSDQPLRGTPLAVVLGADGLADARMCRLTNCTNLSETNFLLEPADPAPGHPRLRPT